VATVKLVLDMSSAESAAVLFAVNYWQGLCETPSYKRHRENLNYLCDRMRFLPLSVEFTIDQGKALSLAIGEQWKVFNDAGERYQNSADMLMKIYKQLPNATE
jgi:hypothetical protein